jgi:hypothetical protein
VARLGKRRQVLVESHARPIVIAKMDLLALVTHHVRRLKPFSVELRLMTLLRNALILVPLEKMESVKTARSVSCILLVEISTPVAMIAKNLLLTKTRSSVVVISLMHPLDVIFLVHLALLLSAL